MNAYVFEDPEAALRYKTSRTFSQSSADVAVISTKAKEFAGQLAAQGE